MKIWINRIIKYYFTRELEQNTNATKNKYRCRNVGARNTGNGSVGATLKIIRDKCRKRAEHSRYRCFRWGVILRICICSWLRGSIWRCNSFSFCNLWKYESIKWSNMVLLVRWNKIQARENKKRNITFADFLDISESDNLFWSFSISSTFGPCPMAARALLKMVADDFSTAAELPEVCGSAEVDVIAVCACPCSGVWLSILVPDMSLDVETGHHHLVGATCGLYENTRQ